jgi:4a-hydroxytetrahydrobiopterin dehydratase
MSRPELLSKELIDNHSALLPMWINDGLSLKRQFILSNFASAIGFINAIAILSEARDHHPDIHLYGWNKVSVLISTHDKGGLTELDFQLASKIDSISF